MNSFKIPTINDVWATKEICLHNFLKFCYMLCVHIEWALFALLFIHAGNLHVYLSRFRKQSVLSKTSTGSSQCQSFYQQQHSTKWVFKKKKNTKNCYVNNYKIGSFWKKWWKNHNWGIHSLLIHLGSPKQIVKKNSQLEKRGPKKKQIKNLKSPKVKTSKWLQDVKWEEPKRQF